MPKIIVVAGIPASGKTTWSKEFISNKNNWIRINRDDIRKMFGDYWIPSRENLVENAEKAIAEEATIDGYNIIIDDTNLNPLYISYWEKFAKNVNYEYEYKKFDVSLEEALYRDKNRENPVGEDVIKSFYQKYYGKVSKDI